MTPKIYTSVIDLDVGSYKFVRVVSGQFRYAAIYETLSFSDLLQEGEKATDAGTFHVLEKTWRMVERGSTTLGCWCSPETEEELAKRFKPLGLEKGGVNEVSAKSENPVQSNLPPVGS